MLLTELPLHMLPPQAVMLTADVVLLSVPDGEGAPGPLPVGSEPPYGSVSVQNRAGPLRIVATRWRENGSDGEQDGLDFDQLGAPTCPFVLGADLEDLAGELDDASRWRLLGFLLGFCCKAFDLSESEDFAVACRKLAQSGAAQAGIAEPIATVTPAWTVLRGPQWGQKASCFVLGRNRVHRATVVPLPGLHGYVAVERIREGDILLAISGSGQRWIVGPVTQPIRDLILPHPDLATLRAVCLRALVPICAAVASALRERLLLSPAAPVRHDDPRQPIGAALDAALSDGEGRLFLRGWLRDPMRLAQDMLLSTPCGEVALPPDTLFRHRRPDIDTRFASGPFTDVATDAAASWRMSKTRPPGPARNRRSNSGSVRERASHSGQPCASPMQPRPAPRCSQVSCRPTSPTARSTTASARRLRLSIGARSSPAPCPNVEIGRQPENPAISIIVPLYRNLSFLRFQIAALASDPNAGQRN